jgi:hypothetical protein
MNSITITNTNTNRNVSSEFVSYDHISKLIKLKVKESLRLKKSSRLINERINQDIHKLIPKSILFHDFDNYNDYNDNDDESDDDYNDKMDSNDSLDDFESDAVIST